MNERILVFLKHDCPTCELILPLLADIQKNTSALKIIVQDNPNLFNDMDVQEDSNLEISFQHEIETVPTVVKIENKSETSRLIGWDKQEWKKFV